jgi:hypothetical protein
LTPDCAPHSAAAKIRCYQKSVMPFFAMHSAKSTSFRGFELKHELEEAKKRSYFANFSKIAPSFFRAYVKGALVSLISV